MKYEKELRELINNLLKEHRASTDHYILCPICRTIMEFRQMEWHCLKWGCGFIISREQLPSSDEIDNLIKEVKSEEKVSEIKNIIREIVRTKQNDT